MRGLIYKTQDNQLLANDNYELQHYQKLYGSINQKQKGNYSLNNEKLTSVMKINGKKQIRKVTQNDYNTTVRRVNENSYRVSFDKLQQDSKFHTGKSTLTDIYTELLHNKENLLINQGFIHIKEYIVDSYECRCHEHNHLLHDQEINNNKHLFNYKLEF